MGTPPMRNSKGQFTGKPKQENVCLVCKKNFLAYVSNYRRFCSLSCKYEFTRHDKSFAKKHMKDRPSYSAIHYWLRIKYGKADRCENKDCTGISNRFVYALIHGFNYDRDKQHYFKLCFSCHAKYDRLNMEIRI